MKRFLLLLRRIALVALVMWLSACGLLLVIIHYTGTRDEAVRSDLIIVLGAALTDEGKPYKALSRRSEHAAELWKMGYAAMILCTGGIGRSVRIPRSEADGCREVVMREGVPRTAIVLEERSRSTEEQVRNTRDIMVKHGWRRAILVSDSYHVFRARRIFSSMGIHVALSPVPAAKIESPLFYVFSMIREVLALHEQVLK
ncbi:YdcF family protein [Luteitalea pratensis]|nr:YdcF family protein [Luteitalea pratensis]